MSQKVAVDTEKKPVEFRAGQNVFAMIEGKKAGPFYVVQVFGGFAELQGAVTHTVPVADVVELA